MSQPYPFFAADAPVATALVVAHPAHELRLFGWLGRARPLVEVLTTGSRSADSTERLRRTGELVDAAGGRRGRLFGAVLDREFYALLMSGEGGPFELWTETLARDFVEHEVAVVVTDAWQGYSPAHDLAHLMARLAAARAAERLGRPVRMLEYAAVPCELAPLKAESEAAFEIVLDAAEAAAKQAAVQAYPDIAQEAAEIFALEGDGCLEKEIFFRPAPLGALLRPEAEPPFYERAGEARVRAGLYRRVLRRSHVLAIARALAAPEPMAAGRLREDAAQR
jgi:hypothetical protein